jgi:hypothetical protein
MTYLAVHPKQTGSFFSPWGLKSRLSAFFLWCSAQEEKNHIGWVGFSIVIMSVIFFPITMMCILFHGAHFGLIILAMISLDMVVITNLAALSTKYTIPFLLVGILIDLFVIVAS